MNATILRSLVADELAGRIPWGNTGRLNVSPFASMPVPEDLRPYLDGDGR